LRQIEAALCCVDRKSVHHAGQRIVTTKAAFNSKKGLFSSKLDLNLRKKLVKCYIWCRTLYGAETWTLRKVDQKYLESFEVCYCRKMGKISWTDHVRNEEVLHRVKEERNIIHTVKRRNANWIGHILRRNCLLKHFIEGKIEVTGRQGGRCKQLLSGVKERILETERGSTSLHCAENQLWQRLRI
jgi:hypothetical protein